MSIAQLSWPEILEILLQGKDLSDSQADALMNSWLREELTPVQTGAFLACFRLKGATGNELAAMAKVLREACPLPCAVPDMSMVDTCGTGGDGADTFNISTAVAFTAAACGANVSKHGNRSASGKVGSADVLEALGLSLNAQLESVVQAINTAKVTFLFAPSWHPALINLAPLRKSLGVRTIFNLLGPLVNPLRPNAQVLGVASRELLEPMSQALQKLGLKRAVVVHGSGGIDEASLSGPNEIYLLDEDNLRLTTLEASDFGLTSVSIESLKGGDLSQNKNILRSVLRGEGTTPQLEVVALNTALVLWASGIEEDLARGVSTALNCLKSGLPWRRLETLKNALDSPN